MASRTKPCTVRIWRRRYRRISASSLASLSDWIQRSTSRARLVEAGEIEVALRGEVAVEDRLGHAGLAGDLGRGRPSVAAAGEDAAGGIEERGAPFGRR